MNTAEEKTQREQDFDRVMQMSSSPDMKHGFRYGLIIEDGAATCIAQAAGFIRGLYLSDKEQAIDAAHDLMNQFRYLEDYGGTVEEEGINSRVPSYRVSIQHDCTFLGFSLLWMKAVRAKVENGHKDRLYSYLSHDQPCVSDREPWDKAFQTWDYTPAWNGGLLYRGPAAGEVYSVCLETPRFWSIHT